MRSACLHLPTFASKALSYRVAMLGTSSSQADEPRELNEVLLPRKSGQQQAFSLASPSWDGEDRKAQLPRSSPCHIPAREIISGLLSQPVPFSSKELDRPGLKGEPDFGWLSLSGLGFSLPTQHLSCELQAAGCWEGEQEPEPVKAHREGHGVPAASRGQCHELCPCVTEKESGHRARVGKSPRLPVFLRKPKQCLPVRRDHPSAWL